MSNSRIAKIGCASPSMHQLRAVQHRGDRLGNFLIKCHVVLTASKHGVRVQQDGLLVVPMPQLNNAIVPSGGRCLTAHTISQP